MSQSCPIVVANIVSKVAHELSHSGIGSGVGGWCMGDGEGRSSLADSVSDLEFLQLWCLGDQYLVGTATRAPCGANRKYLEFLVSKI